MSRLALKCDTSDAVEVIAHGQALIVVIREKCGDEIASRVETLVSGAIGVAIVALVKFETVQNG